MSVLYMVELVDLPKSGTGTTADDRFPRTYEGRRPAAKPTRSSDLAHNRLCMTEIVSAGEHFMIRNLIPET